MHMTSATDPIRTLNDHLRQHHCGGTIVITRGVQALGSETIQAIDQALAAFNQFDQSNDPHGEHDFGSVQVRGVTVLFKIDYYDLGLRYHSPDPADPSVTHRVMTIMLAEEY
jgi:hypothetical protein